MKKLIGGGLAALAIGLAVAAPANADTTTFLSAMHDVGFYSDVNGDASLVHNGLMICVYLNDDHSQDYIINQTYQAAQGDATWTQAQQFVNIAEANLC